MAHFAELNDEDFVIRVIVVNNDVLLDPLGVEKEEIGISFCRSLYGEDTRWMQTSYNSTFRGTYAGVGMKYNRDLDMFTRPDGTPFTTIEPTDENSELYS